MRGIDCDPTMPEPGLQHGNGPHTGGNGAPPLQLLQLTDLHLHSNPDGRLLGQQTWHTFEAVLALARQRHWPPDALVLTGDLVHDERAEGYRRLRQRLERLGIPFFCIPGNHDRLDLMTDHLDPDAISGLRVETIGGWDLLLLDSTIPLEVGGHIDAEVLTSLDRYASAHPRRPKIVFLHHQPVPVGSRWIDSIGTANGDALVATVARHPSIHALIWGHVHQTFERRVGGVALLATPSTCVQFLPKSDNFALDRLPPGYRWLDLYPDGRIDTGVSRIDAYPEPLRLSHAGY